MGWQQDKAWSDRFLDEVKAILGQTFFTVATEEQDQLEATDLIVLNANSLRIGVRIRRPRYRSLYPNQFTIRGSRPSCFDTEMTKIVDGWGDYLFYGFSCDEQIRVERWMILDLKVFRASLARELRKTSWKSRLIPNGDGSSEFYAFRLEEFSGNIVFRSSFETQASLF